MIAITKKVLKEDFEEKFSKMYAKELNKGTIIEKYGALGTLVREYITKDWIETNKIYESFNEKQVYYFSMEFLLGRLIGDSLNNLGVREICKEALFELNINLEDIEEVEKDQGLGNGGLGRLAACFLDSMASSSIPGHGCGIRYKYGFFDQKIINGSQVEVTDNWLESMNPWEIRKDDEFEEVKFYGNVIYQNTGGRLNFVHENYQSVKAVPYDTPIIGYENNIVNTLRLWSAETLNRDFDFSSFNKGEYNEAVNYKNSVESISYILYPEDSFYEGKLLRLKQQYFFVSAGVQSIIKNYKKSGESILNLDKKVAIHINDTHPTLAIPELIRILIDDEGLGFEEAFEITKNTISYTNHTILSEALEKWQVEMIQNLLPRIYMIIEEINKRYCKVLWEEYTGDWNRISRMAIICDGYVRMANLAIVSSHSVNGVAKLHTEILKTREMSDFYNLYPEKFNNKTNGITHRRWLINSNPKLTNLLKSTIGERFIKSPIELKNLKKHLDDNNVIDKLSNIKESNKIELANEIYKNQGIIIDPKSIFDVQVKRIHGYKRQTLNCLRIMDLYNKILENPNLDIHPRTFIFGGKSAPGYYLAKNIIELINAIANKVNNDKRVNDKIKVVMIENYRVSLAEKIIKATDLSEQISTATKEASGTSNMKFMMNGAVTIATLDGANIEIRDEVSDDNIIIFGLTSEEVINYYKNCNYSSFDIYNNDYEIKEVVNDLVNGKYSNNKDKFRNIHDNLLIYNDEFFVLKDFKDYIKAQERVDKLYRDKRKWQRICGVNIAHSGVFSSDRTIEEYSKEIWGTNAFNKSI